MWRPPRPLLTEWQPLTHSLQVGRFFDTRTIMRRIFSASVVALFLMSTCWEQTASTLSG